MTHLELLMYFMKAPQINQYGNKKESEKYLYLSRFITVHILLFVLCLVFYNLIPWSIWLLVLRWSLEWVEREQKVRFSSINSFRWSRGSRRCCCFTNLFVDLVTSLSWQVTYLLWLDLEQINSILLNTGAYLFTYFLHDIALMLNVASNKKSHRTFQNTVSNPQRASFFSLSFHFLTGGK